MQYTVTLLLDPKLHQQRGALDPLNSSESCFLVDVHSSLYLKPQGHKWYRKWGVGPNNSKCSQWGLYKTNLDEHCTKIDKIILSIRVIIYVIHKKNVTYLRSIILVFIDKNML